MRTSPSFTSRIISRLAEAESSESNPHLQDDYRIARIAVGLACSGDTAPHVSATYTVSGLHPALVWPAILERRAAMLRRTLPAQALPPKKPSHSVGTEPWLKKQTAEVGASAAVGLVEKTLSVASTARAYRNPDGLESRKNPRPPSLAELVQNSTLHDRERSFLLQLLYFNSFAACGTANEIFASAKTIAAHVGLPHRTVRRRLKNLRRPEGPLVQSYPIHAYVPDGPNPGFRRPASYQIDPAKLQQRKPVTEFIRERNQRRAFPRRGPQPVPLSQPALAPPAPAATLQEARQQSAEVNPPQPNPHRSSTRGIRPLNERWGNRLNARMVELRAGVTEVLEAVGGLAYELYPGDPRYKAPMTDDQALTTASQELGLRYRDCKAHMEDVPGWEFGEEECGP